MDSLKALPALKAGTFLAPMRIVSPVWGFLPSLAFSASDTDAVNASRCFSASLLEESVCSTIRSTNRFLFMAASLLARWCRPFVSYPRQEGAQTPERPRSSFGERRRGEVRLSPGTRVQNFSGSSAVASRNILLRDGATNATRSGRFYPEEVPPCRSRVPGADLGGSLATPNFRE